MAFGEFKDKITPRDPSPETSSARGNTVPQDEAIYSERMPLRDWQTSQNIDREAQVKIKRVSHMRYQHPDLDQITVFLRDFGMTVASKERGKRWFKGYGPDHYVYYAQEGPKQFLGGAFEVESYEELAKASKLPTATAIRNLDDAPGGGHIVTVTDPGGFSINLIFGQAAASEAPTPQILTTNYESHKPRVEAFQRFTPGPAAVYRLGHYGLCVTDFDAQLDFYTRNFNLAPTDFLYVDVPGGEDGKDTEASAEPGVEGEVSKRSKERKSVAAFLHVDRGTDPVDHHTFFLSANPTAHVHHCSFEVHDMDTQALGHEFLASKKYTPVWGIGRHILGSQLFDYWWDTSGFMVEHYCDGDMVTEATNVGWGPADGESLAVWGPKKPEWFLD